MSKKLSAPRVDHYVEVLGDFKYGYFGKSYRYDDKTYELLDQIFALVETIAPTSENGARVFWLKADRGPIEDFGDYEDMKAYDEVKITRNMWSFGMPTIPRKRSGTTLERFTIRISTIEPSL